MSSTEQPCVILDCGEVDGVRMTVQVGPFVSMAQASEVAEQLVQDCPGAAAIICRAPDSGSPGTVNLDDVRSVARRMLSSSRHTALAPLHTTSEARDVTPREAWAEQPGASAARAPNPKAKAPAPATRN